MALEIGVILLIVFAILLFLGVPIAISLGIPTIVTMLTLYAFDVTAFSSAQSLFNSISSFTLLAIPFFVLSGVMMTHGGISTRLINFAKLLIMQLPGSLAHTNVVGNMLFGSISGSAVAAAASIGGLMSPLQKKEGYDKEFSAAVNVASAPTGLLIPPSNTLILFSLVSGGTSIAALFIAGYIPGILWGIGVMVVAYFIAKRRKYPVAEKMPFREGMKVIIQAIPSLLLVIIVIGGIILGVFTPTEAASVAVLYAFILMLCYRTFSFKIVPQMLLETINVTGVIMFLIGASSMMTHILTVAGIPTAITNSILGITDNPTLILLIILFVLLLVGTFMDIAPAVLIFTPIFLPIVQSFGMDVIHFGIIIVFAMCIGGITPPVGTILFVGSSIGKVRLEHMIKPMLPFYAVIIFVLLIVTYIPQLSLFLPKLFGLI
ncbi:TRAP transporter large permease [Pseudogracilibacillus sp. SE30717A]|uniref:TRAP transporter large permease n=1 Tax=Pseudogracilibacillus sp. SE30717A TaxID=3098293 RepID=UPI00300E2709